MEPSYRINEKYQTWTFETKSGKVVTGLILAENEVIVKVIENPLASVNPIELKTSEIVSREKSPNSIMPKGLLDKLTKDEVLDLIAYVHAGGNPEHAVYKGGGHQHHHGP